MDIPFSDVEPKLKMKAHFTCPKCGKVFRKEDKFNEHVRKQLCIKKEIEPIVKFVILFFLLEKHI